MAIKDHRRAAQVSALGKKNAAAWRRRPRCGAFAKSTGRPCQRPGFGPSGRCPTHGGATPSGSRWHVLQLGHDPAKNARKLDAHERRYAKRMKRLAAMSADERKRYDSWLASHRPGPPGPRRAARARRRQSQEAHAFLDSLDEHGP